MNSRIRFKRCNRVLAKTSMFTMRLEALLRRYPDCKLVYVIRDPVEVIPSGMSLLAGVLENGYDVWNRTRAEDQQRWLENLYQASCEMLRSFHEAQSAGLIPEQNLCIVRYSDLLQDLEPTPHYGTAAPASKLTHGLPTDSWLHNRTCMSAVFNALSTSSSQRRPASIVSRSKKRRPRGCQENHGSVGLSATARCRTPPRDG